MKVGAGTAEAVFHRSHQSRALRVQPDLQAGNLAQVKTEHPQPVNEAISGVLAQGHDLTNMGRDALSQLVEETCGNEIGRSASVAPASGSRKLSDGTAILVQYIPDALGSSAPATRRAASSPVSIRRNDALREVSRTSHEPRQSRSFIDTSLTPCSVSRGGCYLFWCPAAAAQKTFVRREVACDSPRSRTFARQNFPTLRQSNF